MSAVLHIGLLDHFRLIYGDDPVTSVDTPRLRALFAFLVLHRKASHVRRSVAFTFWPDSTEKQALTNLRHLLHDLRHALPEADRLLRVDNKTLAWQDEVPSTFDVAEFEQALVSADEAAQTASWATVRSALEHAVGVYEGDLLPDCYDAWIEPERERLRLDYGRALHRLIRLLEDQRDYASSIHFARNFLQHDPLQESTYRTLMRLHAVYGDRAAALSIYDQCVEVLHDELDTVPGQATRGLYEQMLTSKSFVFEDTTAPASRAAGEHPLVGRHAEWVRLKTAWRTAAEGNPHLLLVTGEAGIGKTRLAEELLRWCGRQGVVTARTRSYAAEGRLAYAPVAEWLREEAIQAALPRLRSVWLAEVSRILPEIRLDYPVLPDTKPVREAWQRLHLFEAMARAMLANGAPLLLLLDDMQWTDPETLTWLRYLLHFAPEARLLIAGTVRTEEMNDHPELVSLLLDLRRYGKVTEIPLEPLGAVETALVATHVAGRELEDATAERLYQETEGNPLFIVESVRAGIPDDENVPGPAPPGRADASRTTSRTPPRVQAVIAARLGQVPGPARLVAGLAATIGRAFSFEVLSAAYEQSDEILVEALEELWQRQIIREQGTGTYDFSHDKLRETAYSEISPMRRRLLHHQVARALERVYQSHLDPLSGQLASHYERAGQPKMAVMYLHRAARYAKDVHANADAIRLLRKAIALIDELRDTPDRDEQELALQIELGSSLVALHGHGADVVGAVYARALVLCERLGRATDAPILRALANLNMSKGHLQQACSLGEEILHQARLTHNATLLVEGHYVFGVSSFWMGRLAQARHHLEQAISHYDPQQHGVHIAQYAQDPKVVCLCRLGRTLWHLGYPEQGTRKIEDSLSLARVLGHPHSRAYAMTMAGHFYLDIGNLDRARECARSLLSFTRAKGLSMWEGAGDVLEGTLMAVHGAVDTGTTRLRQGISAWTDAGGLLSVSQYYGYLAGVYLRHGAIEEGLAALENGIAVMELTGERFYQAELLRLKAELHASNRSDPIRAIEYYRQALDVARQQEAKSLELRTAISLFRLCEACGDAESSRHMLHEVYSWFVEGFDMPDLMEARALLDARA